MMTALSTRLVSVELSVFQTKWTAVQRAFEWLVKACKASQINDDPHFRDPDRANPRRAKRQQVMNSQ